MIEIIIVSVVVLLFCPMIGSMIASKKGQGAGLGFLLGVLGPIGIIVVCALRDDIDGIESKALRDKTMKQCPACRELVRIYVNKCRYCGEILKAEPLELKDRVPAQLQILSDGEKSKLIFGFSGATLCGMIGGLFSLLSWRFDGIPFIIAGILIGGTIGLIIDNTRHQSKT